VTNCNAGHRVATQGDNKLLATKSDQDIVSQTELAAHRMAETFPVQAGGGEHLINPTKARVRGPPGRRLPSKKGHKSENTTSNPENADPDSDNIVTTSEPAASVGQHKSVPTLDIQSQSTEEESSREKHLQSDLSSVDPMRKSKFGRVDPADFDKAWFFRVPSLAGHRRKRLKNYFQENLCENNNMKESNTHNDVGRKDSATVRLDTLSIQSETPKRKFWKRDFFCTII